MGFVSNPPGLCRDDICSLPVGKLVVGKLVNNNQLEHVKGGNMLNCHIINLTNPYQNSYWDGEIYSK